MRFGRTIIRIRPPGTDSYGDPLPGGDDLLEIPECALAPRATALEGEIHDYATDGVIVGYRLFAPFDADILRTDLIDIDGDIYSVEGEPGRWESPYTQRRPGLVVLLRRTEG